MAELTLGDIFPNKLSSYTTKLRDINTLYLLFYGEQVEELVKLCAWFQFEITGSAEKLTERLCLRLAKLSQLKSESEDENDETTGINDNAGNDDGPIEKEPTTRDSATVLDDEARQQGESRRHEKYEVV
ncbi:hypothetical protein ALC60_01258 [Trachymyrmex zeteki]|uniref:Uncharacterized protein n=1 Tax=Mycetomoellerius zeteki TaxID=64791 RepID=A0A151XH83_9HYME|nr:hypothetical protein ALC60_01258 [Trachymyrmex zeteki]